jgi:hypothetical protein
MAMGHHKSEIRSKWHMTRAKTYLTCVCGELDVEIPQGASVDWPIAKYAAHAFEMAMRQGPGVQVMADPPEVAPLRLEP